jgi:hypothetical protein
VSREEPQKLVAYRNIEHYRSLFERETDETEREVLRRLLAEEETD